MHTLFMFLGYIGETLKKQLGDSGYNRDNNGDASYPEHWCSRPPCWCPQLRQVLVRACVHRYAYACGIMGFMGHSGRLQHHPPCHPVCSLFFFLHSGAPLASAQNGCRTVVSYPSTAVGYRATAVGDLPIAVGCHRTTIGHRPTAVGHCPTPVSGRPNTAVWPLIFFLGGGGRPGRVCVDTLLRFIICRHHRLWDLLKKQAPDTVIHHVGRDHVKAAQDRLDLLAQHITDTCPKKFSEEEVYMFG